MRGDQPLGVRSKKARCRASKELTSRRLTGFLTILASKRAQSSLPTLSSHCLSCLTLIDVHHCALIDAQASKRICKRENSHQTSVVTSLTSSFPRAGNMRVRLFDTCSPTPQTSTTDPSLISDCGNSGLTRPQLVEVGHSSYRCFDKRSGVGRCQKGSQIRLHR